MPKNSQYHQNYLKLRKIFRNLITDHVINQSHFGKLEQDLTKLIFKNLQLINQIETMLKNSEKEKNTEENKRTMSIKRTESSF